MTQDTVYRPYININKTWTNIFRLMKRAELTRSDLSKIFRISPQAVCKKFSSSSLPTLEQLILLSELFEKPIEEILVIESYKENEKEYKELFSKAHTNNSLALKVLSEQVSDEKLYDERLDKLQQEINYEIIDFYKYISPSEYHIRMCAEETSLFRDEAGFSIDNGNKTGQIYLPEFDKHYDLTVPGLKEWYNEYLENWDKSTQQFKNGFDMNKWNNKAIKLIKAMYKLLPQNIFISYSTPSVIDNDNVSYQGIFSVPRD